MGRVKLKIKRLESSSSRLTTYSKRKNGLIKKANELSVLCDIDLVLVMFSPSGKPVLWKGRDSSIEGIIERLAELTPQERAKRKLESFDVLKRSYKKSDHKVKVQDFFGSSYQTIEDLTVQADFLQTQLSEIQKRLSDWNNPEKIDSLELLEQMEDYIAGVLDQIQTQKANIGKQQFLALERNYQLQNAMHVPFSLGAEQQLQHFSCVQNDDSRHMVSLMETNLPPKREMELSSGNSFGNYYGYFGTVEKAEIACTGQGSGILSDLLRTEFLRNELIGLQTETLRNELTKTEYLENEVRKTESLRIELMKSDFLTHELIKNECLRNELIKAESSRNELMKSESLTDEMIRTESLRNEMKTQSLRNELSKTGSLRNEFVEAESFRLQLCEPYSYPQCDFTTLSDKKFQPSQQTNLQTSIEDYRAEGHFEQPQSGYVSNHCNWASTSGPFADATFDEQLYPQQQYSAGGHVTEELGPLDVETTHQHSLINLGPLDVEATHQPSLTH